MKKLLFAALAALLCTGCAQREDGADVVLYVGTQTAAGGRGIYSYLFTSSDATAQPVDTLALREPAALALSPAATYLYAVCAEADTALAAVSAVRLDATGRMTPLGSQSVGDASPCYVSAASALLFVATEGAGTMGVFPLEADGSVAELTVQYHGSLGGPDSLRQRQPRVSSVLPMPDAASVVFTDFSADRLYIVHPGGRADSVSLAPGSGPQRIAFTSDGGRSYCLAALTGDVAVLRCDGSTLTLLQQVAGKLPTGNQAADLHLSPDGRFLYTSSCGAQPAITIYRIDEHTGKLQFAGRQTTARQPLSFCLTPKGDYLICACRDENRLQVFRRDPKTGLLTDTGRDINLPRPLCVVASD